MKNGPGSSADEPVVSSIAAIAADALAPMVGLVDRHRVLLGTTMLEALAPELPDYGAMLSSALGTTSMASMSTALSVLQADQRRYADLGTRMLEALAPKLPDYRALLSSALPMSSIAPALTALNVLQDQRRSADLLRSSISTLPRVDYAAIFGLQRPLDQKLLGVGSLLSSFQTSLAAQYIDIFSTLRPWADSFMGSVASVLRAEIADRPIVRWILAAELHERRWWLVPTWDDALARRMLVAMRGHRGQRAIVKFLRQHYERARCRPLRAMVRGWTLPELNRCRALLLDAVDLYQHGRYRAAVKMLNGIEEAVIKETLIRTHRIDASVARWAAAPTLFALHVGRGRPALVPFETALAALFTGFVWGETWLGADVERHRIAHGGVPQNRAVSALRLFLVLDTLDHYLARLG